MSSYISNNLRNLVAKRASFLCEYCLIHEDDTFLKCQVDHIISLKHGGKTEIENLSHACVFCNRNKGSDIGSILQSDGKFIQFFNPRKDLWTNHFKIEGAILKPLTKIGKVTAHILGFNHPDRIIERQSLIDIGKYPSNAALEIIRKVQI